MTDLAAVSYIGDERGAHVEGARNRVWVIVPRIIDAKGLR